MVGKDNPDCGGKVGNGEIGGGAELLVITMIDQNGAATGGTAAVDIAPAVADHPAAAKIESVNGGGGQEHPRLRLATVAGLAEFFAAMIADLDVTEGRNQFAQTAMHRFHHLLFLNAASDIWLIGGHEEFETCRLEELAALRDSRKQREILHA